MTRILAVEPGPSFSVADVHRGLVKGLRQNGCDVVNFNFGDRLSWYTNAAVKRGRKWQAALTGEEAIMLASKGIEAACYEYWPDVVVITSCMFVPKFTMDLLRARRHKVVVVHTESPYEDDGQVERAACADLNLINDPTNIQRFQAVAPTHYLPHAYDPDVHHPRVPNPELGSDFCFAGTGFPSRVEFLEAVHWTGIDFALAGMWMRTDKDSPLREHLVHPIENCLDNTEVIDLYAATKATANLYRREAERPELSEGWAMGPREVEAAASGTFMLREPRGEGDDVLGMLPTFAGPADFEAQLRWWLRHDDLREEAALKARAAIADRTFEANAARVLRLLDL